MPSDNQTQITQKVTSLLSSLNRQYKHLFSAASLVRQVGAIAKILGVIMGLVGAVYAWMGRSNFSSHGAMLVTVAGLSGVGAGVAFYIAGVFLVAAGEAFKAVGDIAVENAASRELIQYHIKRRYEQNEQKS